VESEAGMRVYYKQGLLIQTVFEAIYMRGKRGAGTNQVG
jgi:hypothetical protein